MNSAKVDRVVLAVKDIRKAMKFFSDTLGIKFDEVLRHGAAEEQKIRAVYSFSELELVEPTSPDSVVMKFIESRGEGLYGVVFKVDNLEEAVKKMEKRGLKPINVIESGKLKEVVFNPRDSYGVMIILCEYEQKHGATIAAFETE